MSTLLHTCCGPCLAGSYDQIKTDIAPTDLTLFWENPNIHPYLEYRERLLSFNKAAQQLELRVIYGELSYGLDRFIKTIGTALQAPDRCRICYEMRLDKTAATAARYNIAEFSTTLLISPYQDHELICAVCEQAAEKYGVGFKYIDFRPGFSKSHELARNLQLYRQKYCGCIFSEFERYQNDKKFKIENS